MQRRCPICKEVITCDVILCSGHSAVAHSSSGCMWVFGGSATQGKTRAVTNDLYAYHFGTAEYHFLPFKNTAENSDVVVRIPFFWVV